MGKIVKLLLILCGLFFFALLGYAIFGDLTAPQFEVTIPVTIHEE